MSYQIEQRDEQLRNTTAHITYELTFDRAPQHLVGVRMRVSNITTPKLTVVMPVWSPGSYKVRDYAGHQTIERVSVVASSEQRVTSYELRDKTSIEIDCQGASEVVIDYVVYCNERTVRTNHVNRFHAFVVPPALLMYVEGRMDEIHHVLLKHDATLWPNVSTQLSPVRPADASGVLLGALNYDILADSPIEIGDHVVKTFVHAGAQHELAIASTHTLDADWLVEQLKRIITVEAAIFGGVPYDRYVFILQAYPGTGGGLEHTRSSVNACDPAALLDKVRAKDVLSLLCHEYFHLWNVKRIRPIELGPFDYSRENYTPMLWLAEGLTSYYDDLLTYRCGFFTEKEYLDTLASEHVGKLLRVPGRFKTSVRDSSYLAWLKLYMQSPDANSRCPSYYLKGGVVFLLLDLYVVEHSDGKATLDDGLRLLWKRYQENPSVGLTEDECIALLERGTGVQLRDRLLGWLSGTEELPYDEILAPMGLLLTVAPAKPEAITFGEKRSFATVPPTLFVGWTLAETNGKLIVKAIEDGTPAQEAGIGIDDEIVAVNGRRVTSAAHLDQHLAAAGGIASVSAHCDGRLYTTTLTATPVMKVTLDVAPSSTDQQKELRAAWLRRTV
ncbi:MAG: M61 family peptidase [Ignavibacteriae bacterium]|nr:MAG: M61 family peptidase [Ignavibacteriota bacterium]